MLGFREEDFWATTPRAFFNAWQAHNRVEEEKLKRGWEQARFITLGMVNCWSKHPVSAIQYCRFPWEQEVVDAEEGRQRFEWLVKRHKRIDERHGR